MSSLFRGDSHLKISHAAKKALIGKQKYEDIDGDGIVQVDSQRLDLLLGLPAGIDIVRFNNTDGIFHTDEHDDVDDIQSIISGEYGW